MTMIATFLRSHSDEEPHCNPSIYFEADGFALSLTNSPMGSHRGYFYSYAQHLLGHIPVFFLSPSASYLTRWPVAWTTGEGMTDWQMGRWRQAPRPLGLLLGVILVGIVGRCDGGISSAYVRKAEKTIDMPLDSDVFRVPPGYNAPQQVNSYLFFWPKLSFFYFMLYQAISYLCFVLLFLVNLFPNFSLLIKTFGFFLPR